MRAELQLQTMCFMVACHVQATKKYVPFKSYAQSKLANVMAAKELNRRCAAAGHAGLVTASSVHPGLVDTPLARGYFMNDFLSVWPQVLQPAARRFMKVVLPTMLIPPSMGANSVVYAALGSDDEVAGQYIEGQHTMQPAKLARNEAACAQLWNVSCKLAKIDDPLPMHGSAC